MTALAIRPGPAMTSTTRTLAELAPIALEELQGEAALLTRVDRKYLLPVAGLPRLYGRLDSRTRALEIEGRRTFGYRSCYWDTVDFDSFRRSGQGRRRRFKVRSRTYVDSGISFLEVKTRGPRGTTVKERMIHPEPTGPALDDLAAMYVDQRLAAAGVPGVGAPDLTPSLVTTYRRSTLVTSTVTGLTRATIDTEVAWHLPGSGEVAERLPGLAVVETKGGSTPSPVDRALWRLGHRPLRISKYGTGLALVHDELPNLKWHSVIHRHLEPAPDDSNQA